MRRRRNKNPQAAPRIGLFGIFGAGNAGNDGSLEAMLLFLNAARPQDEIVCICTNPAQVRRSLGVRALPIGSQQPLSPIQRTRMVLFGRIAHELRNFVRAYSICRTLDALIFPGTGILDDFGESPFGVPAALLGWCLAAKLAGARVSFVSVGAGPIHHPVSRFFMKRAMKLADYRSYRDVTSKAFIAGIGLDPDKDGIFPDLVFALPAPQTGLIPPAARTRTVGIGIMNYHGWRNNPKKGESVYRAYIGKMATFTAWILDQGYSVRILTGDAVDRKAVADLMAALAPMEAGSRSGSIVAEPIANLHELMREIAMTDFVVASRFHNIVCSLKLCRPALSISYSNKNDDLMADMGLAEYCQSIEGLDVGKLMEQFLDLEAQGDLHRTALSRMNTIYQSRLHLQNVALVSQLPQHESGSLAETGEESGETQGLTLLDIKPDPETI